MKRSMMVLSALLLAIGAAILPGMSVAAPPPTPANVITGLVNNTKGANMIDFWMTRTFESQVIATGVKETVREFRKIHYVKAIGGKAEDLIVERLEPTYEMLKPAGEFTPPKIGLVGMPLWILDPARQVTGDLLQTAAGPTGYVVLKGRPDGPVPAAGYPRWEALVSVSKTEYRLVSVTRYADSGEIETTIGFEDYADVGTVGSAVWLPLTVRGKEYARLNTVTGIDRYSNVEARPTGTKSPFTLVLTAPVTVTAGYPFSVTVTAVGAFPGTVELASSDPLAILPAPPLSLTGGKGVFEVILPTPSIKTIRVEGTVGKAPSPYDQVLVKVVSPHEFIPLPAGTLADLDFYGPSAGWACGGKGMFQPPFVMHYDGTAWTEASVPAGGGGCRFQNGRAISLTGPGNGFMAVNGGLCMPPIPPKAIMMEFPLVGGSWLPPVYSEPYVSAGGMMMVTASNGWQGVLYRPWPTYAEGYIYHYKGTSWIDEYFPEPPGTFVSPSYFTDIHFVRGQSSDGWAVDNNGDLFRFQSGTGWKGFLQTNMLDVWMNSTTDVWACGYGGAMLHFNGTTWTSVPTPPGVADADLNGLAFFDAGHGIAVGGRDPASTKEYPAVIYYKAGVWQELIVVAPEGLADVRLTEVRMTAIDEAWAIGIATDLSTGYTKGLLVRIKLPDPPASAAAASPAVAVTGSLSIGSLTLDKASVESTSAVVRFSVNAACKASLVVLDEGRRPVRRFSIKAASGANKVTWNLRDEAGTQVMPGTYTFRLEVANDRGKDVTGLIVPMALPGPSGEKGK